MLDIPWLSCLLVLMSNLWGCVLFGICELLYQAPPKSQCLFPYLQAVILEPSDSRLLQASISTISTLSLHFLHWVICMQLTNQWRKNVNSSWGISGAKTQNWHTPFLLTYHWPELAIASVWFKGSWEVESTCTSTGNESVWKTHGILSATLRPIIILSVQLRKIKWLAHGRQIVELTQRRL